MCAGNRRLGGWFNAMINQDSNNFKMNKEHV